MRKIGKMGNPQLREHQFNVLVDILSKVQSKAELHSVLSTILTTSEKNSISQRITIFCRVRSGKKYYEIEGALGVSSTTISKALDLYLKNGNDNHNFNEVLGRYKEPEFKYKIKSKYPPRKVREEIIGIRSLQRSLRQNKNKQI